MAKSLNIPEALQMTLGRVMQRVPADKQNDEALQHSVLQFLKLGGERLAKARIQPVIAPFPEDVSVVKPRPLATSLDLDSDMDIDEESDDSDDDDDLDDDDLED